MSIGALVSILIKKTTLSVNLSVDPAMRFVVLQCIVLKLSMGVGDGPMRFKSIFLKRSHQRSKAIQRSNCLRNALWPLNPWPECSAFSCNQRSHRGHLGSTRDEIAQECPMATKFGMKNPWSKCIALLGQRSCRDNISGQPEGNCPEIPKATKCGQCRFTNRKYEWICKRHNCLFCWRAFMPIGALQ